MKDSILWCIRDSNSWNFIPFKILFWFKAVIKSLINCLSGLEGSCWSLEGVYALCGLNIYVDCDLFTIDFDIIFLEKSYHIMSPSSFIKQFLIQIHRMNLISIKNLLKMWITKHVNAKSSLKMCNIRNVYYGITVNPWISFECSRLTTYFEITLMLQSYGI